MSYGTIARPDGTGRLVAYIANAPTEDERFYAPLSETVGTRPLWISPSQNRWCDVLMCRGAGLVNRHYHRPAIPVRGGRGG